MTRARFTEEQIIGVLKVEGARGGGEDRGSGPQARRLRGDALQLEGQVRRPGRARGQAAEATRGREREAEEAAGRADARRSRASRASVKKMVGPGRQARRRRASAGRDGPFGTAGLLHCRRGSQDDPLPLTTRAGHGTSDAIARSRQRTAAHRLSTPVHPAAPGRGTVWDQPHLPALSRRRPDGAQATGSAARTGDNGFFRAQKGPDPCTRIGSPIGQKLAALFGAQPATATANLAPVEVSVPEQRRPSHRGARGMRRRQAPA
jgi:hypothetical protein